MPHQPLNPYTQILVSMLEEMSDRELYEHHEKVTQLIDGGVIKSRDKIRDLRLNLRLTEEEIIARYEVKQLDNAK